MVQDMSFATNIPVSENSDTNRGTRGIHINHVLPHRSLSVCLSVCQSVILSVSQSVSQSVRPYVWLSVRLSVCLCTKKGREDRRPINCLTGEARQMPACLPLPSRLLN